MAIHAHRLALTYLCFQRLERVAGVSEHGDVRPFLTYVVELQDRAVRLAAVDAGVVREVLVDELFRSLTALPPASADLVTMQIATPTEVLAEALAAPPLVAVSVAVEGSRWQQLATASAAALLNAACLWPLGRLGVFGRSGRERHVSNPHADR